MVCSPWHRAVISPSFAHLWQHFLKQKPTIWLKKAHISHLLPDEGFAAYRSFDTLQIGSQSFPTCGITPSRRLFINDRPLRISEKEKEILIRYTPMYRLGASETLRDPLIEISTEWDQIFSRQYLSCESLAELHRCKLYREKINWSNIWELSFIHGYDASIADSFYYESSLKEDDRHPPSLPVYYLHCLCVFSAKDHHSHCRLCQISDSLVGDHVLFDVCT